MQFRIYPQTFDEVAYNLYFTCFFQKSIEFLISIEVILFFLFDPAAYTLLDILSRRDRLKLNCHSYLCFYNFKKYQFNLS